MPTETNSPDEQKLSDKYVGLKCWREENGSVTFEVVSYTDDFEINCAIRGVVDLFPELAQQFYEKGMESFAAQLDEARKEIKKDGNLQDMPVLGQA